VLTVRTAVGEGVRGLLRRRGWIVEKPSARTDEALRRARLLADARIATVLDVGANVGTYGRELRAHGYGGRIVSFEPLSGAYAKLRAAAASDPRWETQQLALGEEDGSAELNVSTEDVWSSMLPRDDRATTENLAYVGTETVRTARLDSLDVLDGAPTWLKLDVQGFELQVLRGAAGSLGPVAGVECEMSLEPFYEGQPSVRELVDALDDLGFRLAATSNGFVRATGRPMWLNGVFLRAA
jgi:FkbM family methyltransferase